MTSLDRDVLQSLAVKIDVRGYVRVLKRAHASSPLGMGYGKTRFSSPSDSFKLLYLAQNPATAIAETIVRDRFDGHMKREILREEFDEFSIAEVRNPRPLFLLDLRYEGASVLGVSTDAVRSKDQIPGRELSQEIHDRTDFDGIAYMSRITNRECVAVYERAVVTSLEADSPAIELPKLASLTAALATLRVSIIT